MRVSAVVAVSVLLAAALCALTHASPVHALSSSSASVKSTVHATASDVDAFTTRVRFRQPSVQQLLRSVASRWPRNTAAHSSSSSSSGVREESERVGGAFDFFPVFVGSLVPENAIAFSGKCFDKCTAVLASLDTWKGTARIEVKLEAPRDKFCIETLLFATEERFVPKLYFLHGEHELLLEGLRPDEVEELQHVGMQTFAIDAGIIPTIVDLFDTVLLFKGNWTEQESFWFLKTHLNITYDARTYGDVDVPEDMIPDGTYLATQRFDGTEVMIQYGTGSYSGHSTIALRINGSLHVCESTDKNSPPYWPPPYGIICTPYAKWIALAKAARYMVSLMPLRADLQAKFDSAAAQRFVAQSLGLPYGYHNFIWGFIDTPTQNFPPPLSEQFFSVAFSVFDRTSPALATRIYVSGMNKRLGTSCNNTECLVDEIMRRNTTLGEVMTVPEQDSWVYNDGPSMVCNVFVLEVLKAAGVFGTPPLRFQATEFTPRDLYTMAIFDPTYKQHLLSAGLPCPPVPADVCQITGPYVAQFPHWNSIKPYADMCERCPGMPPDYTRPDGC